MASTKDNINPRSWCKHMRKGRGQEQKRNYHGRVRAAGKKECVDKGEKVVDTNSHSGIIDST